ncbi:MAG TPA: hypothetical protein VMT16_14430 [Thermoanaerobaculia bacterium]|nr:hypothetical protein [Thermoanaerobaculia bacterium]
MRQAHVLLLLLAAVAAGGCARDAFSRLPQGTLWYGDAAAADAFLAQLQSLAGTPAAHAAGELRERLDGCSRFLAFCPRGGSCRLQDAVTCEPADATATAAAAALGDAAWIFAGEPGGRRVYVRATPDEAAGWRFEAAVDRGAVGAVDAVLPAAEPPGRPTLAAHERLLHLHVRPDRKPDLEALAPDVGWVEQLYLLHHPLLSGHGLEGSWELATYLPAAGEAMAPTVVALAVREPEKARQAMEDFLARAMERWPLRRSDWSLEGAAGACLSNLNVLPQLAPCYVLTSDALVIGWNATALERALAAASGAATAAAGSELSVDLASLPEADLRLQRAYGHPRPVPGSYPWSSLRVEGRREGGRYALQATLAGPPTAPAP